MLRGPLQFLGLAPAIIDLVFNYVQDSHASGTVRGVQHGANHADTEDSDTACTARPSGTRRRLNEQLERQNLIREHSKGENSLKNYRQPQPLAAMPGALRRLVRGWVTLSYDVRAHDLQGGVARLFGLSQGRELLTYSPSQSPFHYDFARKLRERVRVDPELCCAYTRLIQEVVAPWVLAHVPAENTLLYQYPPTLRVHPTVAPPRALGRLHRDAEFGHQRGEINIWLPLTTVSGSGTIWVERRPDTGEFEGFELKYGEMRLFDGVHCRHLTQVKRKFSFRM